MPESDLRYVAALPRPELRNALRRAQAFDPPLRILAEDVLGADSSIDFVAVDPDGRVILVLIGEDGEDRELLTRAIAQRAWVRPRIRDEIWLKLWGNLSFNPVSVLTQGTLADIAEDGETRAVVHAMMVEAQAVGEALGVEFAVDVEARIEMGAKVGAHRSSMLQDLLRGRPLEIDPIVTVIHEMGRMVGLATPTLDMVLGLVRQRARIAEREALAGGR